MTSIIPPQYALAAKAAIVLAAVTAAVFWHHSKVADHDALVISGIASQYNSVVVKQQSEIIARQEARVKKEIETNELLSKNQAIVTNLSHNLRSIRLRKPSCGSPINLPTDTATSSNTDGGTGVLQQESNRDMDEAKQGFDSLIERCDKLNIDAIKSNGVTQ